VEIRQVGAFYVEALRYEEVSMINLEDVKQLLAQENEHILSLYLQVDASLQENQAATPAWRSWLNNALRETDAAISDDQRPIWIDARDRVLAYLEDFPPHVKGLALFLGTDVEQIYELPIPLDNNAIHFGVPMIAPLLWAIDEYEPYLVVMVDKDEARFLQVYLGSVEHGNSIVSDRFEYDFAEKTAFSSRPSGSGFGSVQGADQDNFDDTMDEHISRLHRETAQQARELMKQMGAERLIIGGAEKSAHAVEGYLHEEAAAGLAGVVPVPFYFNDAEVLERITPIAQEFERQKEMELVEQVIDFAKSGGRGALGRKEVMAAMEMQQVEMFVIPWPLEDDEWIQQLPIQALHANTKIELVSGEAAERLKEEGGLGARLYYAIQPV